MLASGLTRSSSRSAPAGWARSTGRATRGSSATSRSRCCRRTCRPSRRCASASSARRRRSRSSRTPTSARSTTSARTRRTDYLVMELLEGETLAARLARGPLPLEQTLRFGVEIADALDKAHRQGIVHRDLKPGNVMLHEVGRQAARLRSRQDAMAPREAAVRALTSLPTMAAAPTDGSRERSSARSSTWRPSSSRARRPTRGPTSSRSARCSTRW